MDAFLSLAYLVPLWIKNLWWLWLILSVCFIYRGVRATKTGSTVTEVTGTRTTREIQYELQLTWIGVTFVVLFVLSLGFMLLW